MNNDLSPVQDRLSDRELNDLYERGHRSTYTEMSRPTLTELSGLSIDDSKLIFGSAPYRQSVPWNPIQKSRLIESFLLNIPVVPVVLFELNVSSYEIVDGEQRIMAIVYFFANNFQLEGMESLVELNGMNYNESPRRTRYSLNERRLQATIILINPDSEFDPEVVKQITYKRLNDRRIISC